MSLGRPRRALPHGDAQGSRAALSHGRGADPRRGSLPGGASRSMPARTACSYRLNKFVRRNTRGVVAAALALVALVSIVVYYTVRVATARNAAVAEAARAPADPGVHAQPVPGRRRGGRPRREPARRHAGGPRCPGGRQASSENLACRPNCSRRWAASTSSWATLDRADSLLGAALRSVARPAWYRTPRRGRERCGARAAAFGPGATSTTPSS